VTNETVHVILSEAKNLACASQMLHLRFSMTAHQVTCHKAVAYDYAE